MKRIRFEISEKSDRQTLATIFASNGYNVQFERERKDGSKVYNYYVSVAAQNTAGDETQTIQGGYSS
mgnify:CR=1 FL=1